MAVGSSLVRKVGGVKFAAAQEDIPAWGTVVVGYIHSYAAPVQQQQGGCAAAAPVCGKGSTCVSAAVHNGSGDEGSKADAEAAWLATWRQWPPGHQGGLPDFDHASCHRNGIVSRGKM